MSRRVLIIEAAGSSSKRDYAALPLHVIYLVTCKLSSGDREGSGD
jgi:hypothetical protein